MIYYVIFREDARPDGSKGKYHLSSREFASWDQAKKYADTISPSRDPKVLEENENYPG